MSFQNARDASSHSSEGQLQTAVRKYSHSQAELNELLLARAATPRQARAELARRDHEVEDLQRKMAGLETEIQHLRSLTARQSEVMGVQAKAIQQALQGNAQAEGRAGPPSALPAGHFSRTEVGGGGSGVAESGTSGRSTAQRIKQTRVNEFGSPEVVQTQPPSQQQKSVSSFLKLPQPSDDVFGGQMPTRPINPFLQPNSFQQQPQQHRMASNPNQPARPSPLTRHVQSASASETMAVIKYKEQPQPSENSRRQIQTQLNKVFEMSEKYCLAHANFPNNTADALLPSAHKEKLFEVVGTPETLTLMGSAQTRYLCIAKVINVWIVKHILKPTAFAGLDDRIDKNITETKAQIYQSTPAAVRFLLLNAVANELRKLTENGGYQMFVNCLARERGNQLWSIVKPLMHQKTSRDWDDLFTLMVEAHKLAEIMYTTPNEFKFTHVELGVRFSVLEMIQRDRPPMQRDPGELEGHGARIALAVAPEVMIRINNKQGDPIETIIVQPQVWARFVEQPKW